MQRLMRAQAPKFAKLFENVRPSALRDKSVALMVHVGYFEMWEEMKYHIRDFLYLVPNVTVYVNIVRYSEDAKIEAGIRIGDECKRLFPDSRITISPNQGCDIGGYFFMLKNMYENEDFFDYFVFIHTKSTYYWKTRMFEDMLGSYYLNAILKALEDPNVGQVCCQEYKGRIDNRNPNTIVTVGRTLGLDLEPYVDYVNKTPDTVQRNEIDWEFMLQNEIDIKQQLEKEGCYTSDEKLRELPDSAWNLVGKRACKKYFLTHTNRGLKHDNCRVLNEFMPHKPKTKQANFSAGTIFWMKQEIMDSVFQRDAWKVQTVINSLERNQIDNGQIQSMVHAWERVFGILCYENGKRVIGTIEATAYLEPQFDRLPQDVDTSEKTLCVFACRDQSPDASVFKLITELSLYHDEVHVLASGDLDLEKLQRSCDGTIRLFKIAGEAVQTKHYFYIKDRMFEGKDLDQFHKITFADDGCLLLGSLFEAFLDARESTADAWGFVDSYYGSLHSCKGLHHLAACYPRIFTPAVCRIYYQMMKNANVEKMLSSPYVDPGFQKYFTENSYQLHFYERLDIDLCCTLQKMGLSMESMVKVSNLPTDTLFVDVERQDFDLVLGEKFFPLLNKFPFNYPYYMSLNPDLSGLSEDEAKLYYRRRGYDDGQSLGIPFNFNWKLYLMYNRDVKLAGVDTEAGAKAHYIFHGEREDRILGFDIPVTTVLRPSRVTQLSKILDETRFTAVQEFVDTFQ